MPTSGDGKVQKHTAWLGLVWNCGLWIYGIYLFDKKKKVDRSGSNDGASSSAIAKLCVRVVA